MMLKNKFFKAHKVEFNYFDLTSDIRGDNLMASVAQGNNILVGNSGDFTNNHLDIFEYLHRLNLKDNKIYSFLSYGGTKEYKDKVKEVGLSYFGNNFIPIEEYLPYDKFSDIILSCGNVIMGHERQQAMGNIYMSLWNGCKLFLSETSVAYNCLKKRGYKLFTIQNDLNELTINREMPLHDKMENRKLLVKYNSPKVFMEKIHKIYDLIEKSQDESQL
jgi:dTDP-N-acetylfucosamine:lipid II N-acetylfucosaminyltransferase